MIGVPKSQIISVLSVSNGIVILAKVNYAYYLSSSPVTTLQSTITEQLFESESITTISKHCRLSPSSSVERSLYNMLFFLSGVV